MKKIFCLFSISNDYDQPSNNLECVWLKKPNHDELKKLFFSKNMPYVTDVMINDIRKKRKEVNICGYYFRLREIDLGVKLA